jgi:hypothetical protein
MKADLKLPSGTLLQVDRGFGIEYFWSIQQNIDHVWVERERNAGPPFTFLVEWKYILKIIDSNKHPEYYL